MLPNRCHRGLQSLKNTVISGFSGSLKSFPLAKWNLNLNAFVWGIWYHLIFPDTYYPYPMGLPNFCYHLAIKKMAINGKIRLVSLVVYNYIYHERQGNTITFLAVVYQVILLNIWRTLSRRLFGRRGWMTGSPTAAWYPFSSVKHTLCPLV